MALFNYRPLVFVSSSISALKAEREQTKRAIEATGLADAWLFEFHATAAGDPPDAQYLAHARSSDVFVLLVADTVSTATWQEYEEAYADNPSKILPFLVGPQTEANKDERELLAARHTYKPLGSPAEIPTAVAAAVKQSVGSGALLVRPLDALVKQRIARVRALIGLPSGLELPSLAIGHPAPVPMNEALQGTQRAVLTGPPGSGKTHAALQLLANRQDRRLLPTFVHLSGGDASLWVAIGGAVRPARFEPGLDLLRQWAHDGRLSIVFDGLDELPDDEREDTLNAIDRFALEYPRCTLLVTIRVISESSLPAFARVALAPLPDGALVDLFKATGYDVTREWDLPDRFADLIRRPLWAGLLTSVGLAVHSAVELLQAATAQRIAAALPNEPLAAVALRAGLRILALEDQANTKPSIDSSLKAVDRWQDLLSTGLRHQRRPSDWYLEQAGRTALAMLDGDRLVFAHPLVSAFLGAEALVETPTLGTPSALSRDGRVFLAVLLEEGRRPEVLAALGSCDIFGLASVSRLAPLVARSEPIEADLAHFDSALTALAEKAGLVAASSVPSERTSMCRSGEFVALRRVPAELVSFEESDDLTSWASPDRETISYTCWMPDPFRRETPELLAAAELVALFKRRFAELRPPGSPWPPFGDDMRALLSDRPTLSARLLSFVRQQRAFRLEVLEQLGLEGHPLASGLGGDPHVTVMTGGAREPRYTVTWGYPNQMVAYAETDPDYRGDSLASVLADAKASAWHDLTRELEELLDSSLDSQAPARPTRFPEWIV